MVKAVRTTIIIPTYNEADNIPELVIRIRQATDGVRILVMDDSPNPHTANAAWEAGCEVIQRSKDRGLSKAVIDGIRYTASEKIIVMDADLQHPPEILPKLIKALDTNDFVVASRYVPGGDCEEWDLDRKVISRVANLAARPLVPKVKDLVSGFFGFRRDGLPNLNQLNSGGFKIMLELLVKGHWNSVVEVPFTFGIRTKGETKMRFEQIRDYLLQLYSLYLHKFKRVFKFLVVGTSGAIISLGTLYLLTDKVGLLYLVSYIPAFVLAVGNNYLWNSLWTFKDKKAYATGLGKYALISIATLVVRELLLYGFTDLLGIWYMASGAILILLGSMVNFILSKRFVWNKSKGVENEALFNYQPL